MNKKCIGCGTILQDNNDLLEGYVEDIRYDFCKRCFKMRNYGEYENVFKPNEEYIKILKKIKKSTSLVCYVIDLLSFNNISEIKEYIDFKNTLLILNKRDALPKSLDDNRIKDYFKSLGLGFLDITITSGDKNYNLDNLIKLIKKYRTTDDVYFVGYTNAGKSTLINKIIENYSIDKSYITISPMLSTTLDSIKLKFSSFYIIDTPGLVDNGNILKFLDTKTIKEIQINKEIKPKTFQVKKGDCILVGDFLRINYNGKERNSLTFFVSNNIKIKKVFSWRNNKLTNLSKRELNIPFKNDIVISGLGFIKIVLECSVSIYCNKDILITTRKSLI